MVFDYDADKIGREDIPNRFSLYYLYCFSKEIVAVWCVALNGQFGEIGVDLVMSKYPH